MKLIKEAQTYQDLLLVAFDVIECVHDEYGPQFISMVCGPISTGGRGSRPENLAVFSRAIKRACSDGLVVFNQMPFEDDMLRLFSSRPEMGGLRLLEEFYKPIFKSGFIELLCFLPGWRSSIGAQWEHDQAQILQIPILYLSDEYTAD